MRFPIALPLGFPDPLEPPAPEPAPEPSHAISRAGKLRCEFCRCELSPVSGEYQRLSPEAKAMRAQDDTIETLRAEIVARTTERDTALRERDEARAKVAPDKRESWWLRDHA